MPILMMLSNDNTCKMFLADMPSKFVWKNMLKHLTKTCKSVGIKQNNITQMEYVSWDVKDDEHPYYKEQSARMAINFKLALYGNKRLESFYLLRYSSISGFTILREPLK